jgi:superfamily II DNA/RNA helicase
VPDERNEYIYLKQEDFLVLDGEGPRIDGRSLVSLCSFVKIVPLITYSKSTVLSRIMKRTAEEELEDHRMSKMYKRDDG